jgi:hypothetical protein
MAATNVQVFSGDVEVANTVAPADFTGITYQSTDVKTVITNDSLGATNGSMIQVYKNVLNRTPSAIDYHSEENFNASNVYTLCLNPRGGRIGLNDMNPNSDLTMGARFYNTKGYVGLVGDDSEPIIYKGSPNSATVTFPYTQYSTSNPTNGDAHYFVNPYPGEAQCTVVYDNAQSSANGLVYFYCNGPNHQPSTILSHSALGNSEFTIPLLETGTLRGRRVNAVHVKPVNGAQIRIVAVYWVPFRGVTANIKDGGKLVLGTVGNFGTPEAGLTFRREYETPTGNVLEPTQRLDNGIAWMTDLSTWYNGALGGNGINWSKNNGTYGVSVGARIWYQPGSFISAGGGAGNCGSLYLSAGHSTAASNTPDIAIKSNGNVGIGTDSPAAKLTIGSTASLFFADNRGASTARNWAIRVNNTNEGDFQIGHTGSNTGGLPNFYTTPGDAKVTINRDGNVGIGTTGAQGKLQVSSTSRDSSDSANNVNQIRIDCTSSLSYTGTGGGITFCQRYWNGSGSMISTGGVFGARLGGTDGSFGGGLVFKYNPGGAMAVGMVLSKNGKVGIAHTSPYSRLHIKQGVNNSSGAITLEKSNTGDRWYIYQHDGRDLYYDFNGGVKGYLHWNQNVGVIDFTGQHRNFIDGVPYANYDSLEGLIVSANKNKYYDIDENVTTGANAIQISQSLPLVALSTTEKDKACFGVISGVEDPDTRTYEQGTFVTVLQKQRGDRRAFINSLGEGAIWVTNINGPLESGDYITTSNVAGYGQKQDSEFLANYTVAKITMDCDFDPVTQPVQIIIKETSNVNYWVNTTYENVSEEEYSNLTEESRRTITEIVYTNEDGETFTEQNEEFTYVELEQIIYQKITNEESKTEQEGWELTVRQELVNVLDEHGQIQWEDDPSGATEKAYKIRYLDADGNITDESNHVYRAAFVGCTYHCG